jgi:hypothetical protein
MSVMTPFTWCCGSKKLTESLFTGTWIVETRRKFIANRMLWGEVMTLAAI